MRAQLFKQSLRSNIHIAEVTPSDMYAQIPCKDCSGTGRFELYEDSWDCVDCKGSGYQWVSLI